MRVRHSGILIKDLADDEITTDIMVDYMCRNTVFIDSREPLLASFRDLWIILPVFLQASAKGFSSPR